MGKPQSNPAEDALSAFVSQLGLRSSVLGRVGLVAPWGLHMAASKEMMFHVILRGECYYRISGRRQQMTKLGAGDLVLFPHGSAHALASGPRCKLVPSARVCYTTTTIHGDRFQTGAGKKTEMICGSFAIHGPHAALLSGTLPHVIKFDGDAAERDRWICSTLDLIAHEVSRRADGSDRLIQQLLDALFIQILRSCSNSLATRNRGIFAALKDPAIMKVLSRISGDHARPWTIEDLARDAGLSRTALAVRFQSLFGEGVASFLRHQRISTARRLLVGSKLSIKEIAHKVGFTSPEVFIRNFERAEGVSPRRFRLSAEDGS